MPRAVEALPCGSRSITRIRAPYSARPAATFTVVVVLPTPPFWLATTKTRVSVGQRELAAHRASFIHQQGPFGGGGDRSLEKSSLKLVRRGPRGDLCGSHSAHSDRCGTWPEEDVGRGRGGFTPSSIHRLLWTNSRLRGQFQAVVIHRRWRLRKVSGSTSTSDAESGPEPSSRMSGVSRETDAGSVGHPDCRDRLAASGLKSRGVHRWRHRGGCSAAGVGRGLVR